ncbi:AAC(3) family N-acetyltransferase [Desulfonatronum thioautotrophicum]|uniref:AAC(3) family N-acetyltransferase n=1 Tax=Desulfonatronum thioautotrophicum TaxID=617001 RepID=UPI00137915B8|nr:AAC(3) family N-acetyltransferase [Desulfonatronum thioautotrophicum]
MLDNLGIEHGDRVLVHSGISNLGKIRGGAAGLLALLQKKVGPEGLLLFPVFPFNSLMLSYLQTQPEFSAQTSPSKMGTLTEVVLRTPGRVRSVHPTHSVAGFGTQAHFYLGEHHQDETPFGPHSPFRRIAENAGKILLLGVGLRSATSLHVTEDRMGGEFPVNVYLDRPFTVSCSSDNGETYLVKTSCHDPFISGVRDGNLVEEDFLSQGIYKKIALGNHFAGILDARAMDTRLEHLARKGITIYGKLWG